MTEGCGCSVPEDLHEALGLSELHAAIDRYVRDGLAQLSREVLGTAKRSDVMFGLGEVDG